ncbi:RT0821/Lpp0805 family surface protein [Oryzicola mucosus]|nr:RT0821/Lpp0805 family surface protein [Oryzicola mucosus]
MQGAVQALTAGFADGWCRFAMSSAVLTACVALTACGGGGFSLEKAEVDETILTSNVPAPPSAKDAERLSDETTIRNAVSSSDIAQVKGKPVPWANAETGSRGVITAMNERKQEDGLLCRSFTASRESFDGVGLYKGDVCTAGAGVWRMVAFNGL